MKCSEHFFEHSPNELAAFELVAKILQESNLRGIGIFMSNKYNCYYTCDIRTASLAYIYIYI